jgi:hypothetical protein
MRSKKRLIGFALCIMVLGAGGSIYAHIPEDFQKWRFQKLIDEHTRGKYRDYPLLEDARKRLNSDTVTAVEVKSFLLDPVLDLTTAHAQTKLETELQSFISRNKSQFSDWDLSRMSTDSNVPKSIRAELVAMIKADEDAKKADADAKLEQEVKDKELDELLANAGLSWRKGYKEEIVRRLPNLSADDFMKFLKKFNPDLDVIKNREDVKKRFEKILEQLGPEDIKELSENYLLPKSLRDMATRRLKTELSSGPSEWDQHFMPRRSATIITYSGVSDIWGYRKEFLRRFKSMDLKQLGGVLHREPEGLLQYDDIDKATTQYNKLLETADKETLEDLQRYALAPEQQQRVNARLNAIRYAPSKYRSKPYLEDLDDGAYVEADPDDAGYDEYGDDNRSTSDEYEDEGDERTWYSSGYFLKCLKNDPEMLRLAKSQGFSRSLIYLIANLDSAGTTDAYRDLVEDLLSLQNGEDDEDDVSSKGVALKKIMLAYTNKVLQRVWGKLDMPTLKKRVDARYKWMSKEDRAGFVKLMRRHKTYIQRRNANVPFLKKILPLVVGGAQSSLQQSVVAVPGVVKKGAQPVRPAPKK